MAREIDDFLVQNFCDGFDQEIQRNGSKKLRLQTYFQEIRDLLGDIRDCSSWRPNNQISIRETLNRLDDVWSECQLKTSKINLVLAYDTIKSKLNKIQGDIQKFKNPTPSSNGGAPAQPATSEAKVLDASNKFHGFGDDVISLEKVLVRQGSSEDRFKAIGITGIAGIGKTALCQSLFNTKEVKDYFLPRIWVSMPRRDDPDKKVAILKRMLVNLGVEEKIINEYKGDKELLYALHLQLQGKRYLIVLDDARETDDARGREIGKWCGELSSSSTRDGKWNALAHGLPKGCGGAVIVTSRNEELAKKMVGTTGILHRVLPLSNPDSCWSIFSDAAGPDRNPLITDSDLKIQKKEIFKRCAGLPLTAKMLGQIRKKQSPGGDAPNPGGAAPSPGGNAPNPGGDAPNPGGDAPNEIESHQEVHLAEEAAPNEIESHQEVHPPEEADPNPGEDAPNPGGDAPSPGGAAPNEIESHQEAHPPEEADPNPGGAAPSENES